MTTKRGEVWIANLNPTQGSEQSGTRPVILFQNNLVDQFTRTVIVIPLTTNLRRASLPSCVFISEGEGGLARDSVALCHQIRVIDKTRLEGRLGTISQEMMTAVEVCVLFTMGII